MNRPDWWKGRAAGVFSVDAPGECWLVAKLYCQIRLVFLFHSQYEAILIQVKKERKVRKPANVSETGESS